LFNSHHSLNEQLGIERGKAGQEQQMLKHIINGLGPFTQKYLLKFVTFHMRKLWDLTRKNWSRDSIKSTGATNTIDCINRKKQTIIKVLILHPLLFTNESLALCCSSNFFSVIPLF